MRSVVFGRGRINNNCVALLRSASLFTTTYQHNTTISRAKHNLSTLWERLPIIYYYYCCHYYYYYKFFVQVKMQVLLLLFRVCALLWLWHWESVALVTQCWHTDLMYAYYSLDAIFLFIRFSVLSFRESFFALFSFEKNCTAQPHQRHAICKRSLVGSQNFNMNTYRNDVNRCAYLARNFKLNNVNDNDIVNSHTIFE